MKESEQVKEERRRIKRLKHTAPEDLNPMQLAELVIMELDLQKRATQLEIETKEKVKGFCLEKYHARLNREIRKLKRCLVRFSVLHGEITNLYAKAGRVLSQRRLETTLETADTPHNITELFLWLDEHREKEGRESTLLSMSADKLRQEWSQFHVFEDGTADPILLNADTVLERDKE